MNTKDDHTEDAAKALERRTPKAVGILVRHHTVAVPTPDGTPTVVKLPPSVAETIRRLMEGKR